MKKYLNIKVLTPILIGVGLYLFLNMSKPKEEHKKELRSKTTGKIIIFDMWLPNNYKTLMDNGFTVKLFSDGGLSVADELRYSGYLVVRDADVMSALRKIQYKTQLNQVVTRFNDNAIPVISPIKNLIEFMKNSLSDENYRDSLKQLNALPDGYS